MPSGLIININSAAYAAVQAGGTSRYLPAGVGLSFAPVTLALDPTPDNLIAQARAKAKTVLAELTQIPETLDTAQANVTSAKLPFLVLAAGDGQDVSQNWAVNSTATQIPIDFVYVAKQVQDGTTDTNQQIRARLNVLQAAFLTDFTLGGLVVQTEVQATSAQKANQYQQQLAQIGEKVSVMVLTLAFTLVRDT